MSSQLVSRLNIEDIDSNICIIDYGGFRVLAYKNNPYRNYINATKLCVDDNKEFKSWLRNKQSIELINLLNSEVGENSPQPIYQILDGPNNLRGTYVHPDLLPSILSWISPQFAIKVNRIINLYYAHEKDKEIFDLKTLNEEAERRHQEAMKKADEAIKQSSVEHEETKAILISTRDNLDELRIEHDSTSFKLDKLTHNMTNLSVKDLKSDQYSLAPIIPNKREALIITGVRYSRPGSDRLGMFYVVNRTQLCNFRRSRKLMLRRIFNQEPYSGLTKIYEDPNNSDSYLLPIFYTTTPNPVNLWTTFRVKYETLFRVDNGIIKFFTNEYRIKNLIDDLYAYAGIEPLPIEKLVEEYKNALNTQDVD